MNKHWDHVQEMSSIRRSIDKLFEDFLGMGLTDPNIPEGHWRPVCDIEETPDEIIVCAEIPSMKKEDISISLTHNQLTIAGERRPEGRKDNTIYHRIERSYGKFRRTILMPAEVDPNNASATYRDGLLTINLSKIKKVQPKEITIT